MRDSLSDSLMPAQAAPELDRPLADLDGIGPARAASLERAGLRTVRHLLFRLPRSIEPPARALTPQDLAQPAAVGATRVRARVRLRSLSLWPPRGPRAVLTLRLEALDCDGAPLKAFYFRQPYLKKLFQPAQELLLEGRIADHSGPALLAPRRVTADAGPPRPVPGYAEVEGVPAAVLRRLLVAQLRLLEQLPDPVPAATRARCGLMDLGAALRALHAPGDLAEFERGRRRLALDEVLRAERRRAAPTGELSGSAMRLADPAVWARIRARLPFPLNAEQETVLEAARQEFAAGRRMQRLLHGEVGSGKTAVAFALALAIAAGGGQAAFLAPTEILARQHLDRFRAWMAGARLPVLGLLGDDPPTQRRRARAQLARAEPLLCVGTHALLAPDVRFGALRLAVFDEQHRFGVRQKAALLAKGPTAHVLTMTATPIPRTLAWASYGALPISTLRHRAGAGAPIRTRDAARC